MRPTKRGFQVHADFIAERDVIPGEPVDGELYGFPSILCNATIPALKGELCRGKKGKTGMQMSN
jgi:hypothetical protein